MQWTVFCRVVDNFGDVGVCWRLVRELAQRGQAVRLVIDDPRALAWMAPQGARGVSVHAWSDALPAGDVVVETFGQEPPAGFIQTMAMQTPHPVWINLEHLSAETYVERSHGLPAPQVQGLNKWYVYPGFTRRTGGLLREGDLLQRRAAFDGRDWLAQQGFAALPGERVVSLFCYDNPAWPALLEQLSQTPTLLLLAPGAAQEQWHHLPHRLGNNSRLRGACLPWLAHDEFDHLLWASDINFVRGEDSLVRAIWAGAAWVWQAYPQDDGAHHAKVEALLCAQAASPAVAALWRAWNGMGASTPVQLPALPDLRRWTQDSAAWRTQLAAQTSLADALLSFVLDKAGAQKPGC
jgi:uncharacterized repeat protein (TIGR03837 family)